MTPERFMEILDEYIDLKIYNATMLYHGNKVDRLQEQLVTALAELLTKN
jgi:hypothetical protein